MEIMTASRQWASRPADERFTSLDALLAHTKARRDKSISRTHPNRRIEVRPVEDDETRRSLAVTVNGMVTVPTHWAFGQLAGLVGAPAGYLRQLPADIAADCINYGLKDRPVQEVGTLAVADAVHDYQQVELAAATGPNYGRVWNAQVVEALIKRFGDGVTGDFTVPGEFGKAVEVNKQNTTLYAGDRDMFVFLADEKNRITVPNRRDGRGGDMARGFLVWNSEVGSATLGVAQFLFDYVCCNRIIWGAEGYEEIRVRHTSGAPERWLEEVAPALEAYARSSTVSITETIKAAQGSRFDDADKLNEFLATRFTRGQASGIRLAFEADEGRPMESLWDVTTGATAYARGIANQDNRVAVERAAGKVMALAR